MRALFTEAWSPRVVLSLTFWLNSHLECGGSSSLLIMPGLLWSDRGGLSVSSPSGEWEDTCGLCRWRKFLVWNFIGFPRKPSYSASFFHWIFLLSSPYLITLYTFNSIVSWSQKPSPLRIPWIHQGWTPASTHEGLSASCLHCTQAFDPLHFIDDLRQTGWYHCSRIDVTGQDPKVTVRQTTGLVFSKCHCHEKNGKVWLF